MDQLALRKYHGMSIPLDIIETIIDILAQDDPNLSSAKACSLVCRDFVLICRKHIFASIDLNPPPPANRAKATPCMLKNLLSTTPEIATHIRNLNYCIEVVDFKNSSLIDVFKQITCLRSLTVWHYNFFLQWDSNPLRPALLHLMHLPTLVHLKLFSVYNFVLADLAPCVKLEWLEFVHLATVETANDTLPSHLPDESIRLHRLSTGINNAKAISKMCSLRLSDGLPRIDFTSLTDISVQIYYPDDVETFQNLFSHCQQLISADIAVLGLDASWAGLSKMLEPSLRTLKHLTVGVTFNEENHDNDPLCGLAHEIKKMNNKNKIETIFIHVFIQTDSDCTRGDEWGQLDKALSGWSNLQQVSLNIRIYCYSRQDDELEQALKKLEEKQFPQLSSSKSILFEFAVANE